jgi:uncharacterized protein YcbK (DUF882 family)
MSPLTKQAQFATTPRTLGARPVSLCRLWAALSLAASFVVGSPLPASASPSVQARTAAKLGKNAPAAARSEAEKSAAAARRSSLRSPARPRARTALEGKAGAQAKKVASASSWRAYAKPAWRSGFVRLNNPASGRSWTGYVLGPKNTLLPNAQRQIRAVLAGWRSGRSVPIDPRLTRLIAKVSDTFGGRPIRVVGGYREKSNARNSHHKRGEAFDFSIEGVPNWAVRDYLRQLPSVGVGFYPNSSFVHADVRRDTAYWVDLSGPGQVPRYAATASGAARGRREN